MTFSFPELIVNGGFETSNPPYNWTNTGARIFERSTSNTHGGSYSGHVVDDVAPYAHGIYNAGEMPIESGRPYRLVMWLYITSGTVTVIVWPGETGSNLFAETFTTTGSLFEISRDMVSPSGSEGLNSGVWVYNSAPGAAAEWYVDDISFKRLSYVPTTLVVDQPGIGHGLCGHVGCGHGTTNIPKEDE